MRIPARVNIAQIESALAQISNALGANPMSLPADRSLLGAGGEAALMQAVVTWAQTEIARGHRPSLQTFIASDDDPLLEDFVTAMPGMAAALVCGRASGKRAKDITVPLKMTALGRLHEAYDKPNLDRSGRSVTLLCADQSYPFPSVLYGLEPSGTRSLRSIESFDELARRMFGEIVLPDQERAIPDDLFSAAGGFIYELFSNTHDHATDSFDGKSPISPSIRGIQFKYHSAPATAWKTITEGYEPLEQYFRKIAPRNGKHCQLIEISIFDSGSGLAQNWLKKPLNQIEPEEEIRAVIECFGKGNSTKRHRRFGEGLPLVIKLLDRKRGFLRIRTGRLALHADFATRQPRNLDNFTDFMSWHPDRGPLAAASGTLVTVLLPLN